MNLWTRGANLKGSFGHLTDINGNLLKLMYANHGGSWVNLLEIFTRQAIR